MPTTPAPPCPSPWAATRLRGTPSLVVIDRTGRIRLNAFGQIDDLTVGATLARLSNEAHPQPAT